MGTTAMFVASEEGERIDYGEWQAVVKLAADATGGTLTILEATFEPGHGSSLHVHSRESETFVVLEGAVTFRVGDERAELGPGGIAFGPPGIVHGLTAGADGARMLLVFTPGGVERFFRDIQIPNITSPQVVALRLKHGMESIDD